MHRHAEPSRVTRRIGDPPVRLREPNRRSCTQYRPPPARRFVNAASTPVLGRPYGVKWFQMRATVGRPAVSVPPR
jgi:hypothetical protein